MGLSFYTFFFARYRGSQALGKGVGGSLVAVRHGQTQAHPLTQFIIIDRNFTLWHKSNISKTSRESDFDSDSGLASMSCKMVLEIEIKESR